MRLGQLARKYDLPVQDIIDFLEEQTGEKFHPNAKLYDAIEDKVFTHFELIPAAVKEEMEEPVVIEQKSLEVNTEMVEEREKNLTSFTVKRRPETNFPESPLDDIASVEGELAPATFEEKREEIGEPEKAEVTKEVFTVLSPSGSTPKEDEVIQTDKLLEMIEAGEIPADLDKIKLIKAPKKELAGLKVLGKVELPEPRKKEKPEEKQVNERGRNERPHLSEQEREKRRLEAKRKREAHEAKIENRRKEREQKELKKRKEAHYRQKLEKANATAATPQKRKTEEPSVQAEKPVPTPPAAQPKSVFGKFWRWLNT